MNVSLSLLFSHSTLSGKGYPDTQQSNLVSDPQITVVLDGPCIFALGSSFKKDGVYDVSCLI